MAQMIDPRRYDSLGELLADACVQFKTEVALIECERARETERLTYRAFDALGRRLFRGLSALGVGEGDRVAICMGNQSRWLVTAYAVLLAGAVIVPIDWKLTGPEQEALLAHCKPKLLVAEGGLWKRMPSGAAEVPHVLLTEAERIGGLGGRVRTWESALSDDDSPVVARRRSRRDPATIVYSSGTGGRPKGCVLSHGAYLAQLASLTSLYPMVIGDRYFSILPTNHAIDFMCGFLGPLTGGAMVVHQRTLRPEIITDTMKRYRITHMSVVPLILAAFEKAIHEKLDALPPWQRAIFDALGAVNQELTAKKPNMAFSRALLRPIHDAFGGELRLLICGGAFVDRKRAEFFHKIGLPVVIGYGLTEAGTAVTVNDLRPFRGDSVGGPLPGVELEVRGAAPGEVGEVWIRSETLMSGYLDDPEQTAEVLVDGWLKTGDRGWLDAAGHLHLVGRSKNMIVTEGGKNVYPEDVEGAFEGVPCEELVVYAADYLYPRGQDALVGEQLVLVVRVLGDADEQKRKLSALHEQLRQRNQRLPDGKRIGAVLAWETAFPRTASMKIKRDELATTLRTATARTDLEVL